jgi:hypothetical protein
MAVVRKGREHGMIMHKAMRNAEQHLTVA